MAALGEMKLFGDNNEYDSGVAFELLKAPSKTVSESYKNAKIQLSSGVALIICSFDGACDRSEALKKGSELVEEYLDLLSFIQGIDLATKNRDERAYVWWVEGEKKIVSVTLSLVHNISPEVHVELASKDKEGNVTAPVIVSPEHHNVLRFFRRSQVTDDLFEAYRNMYLAFELLASVISKKIEHEPDWIRRVLDIMDSRFGLFKYICSDGSLSAKSVCKVIYTDSRLLLFHAKDGRLYYLPASSDIDRSSIQKALKMLSDIMVCVVPQKFKTRRKGGCQLSLHAIDGMKSAYLSEYERFIVSSQAIGNPGGEKLSGQRFIGGVKFPAKIESQKIQSGEITDKTDMGTSEEIALRIRHAEITGTIDVSQLTASAPLTTIGIVSSKRPVLLRGLGVPFDVIGFDRLDVCFSVEFDGDGNHPKRHHSC